MSGKADDQGAGPRMPLLWIVAGWYLKIKRIFKPDTRSLPEITRVLRDKLKDYPADANVHVIYETLDRIDEIEKEVPDEH